MTTITKLSAIQTMARRFMDAHRTFGCAELVPVAIRWPETETWDCQVFDRDAVERLEEQALKGARFLVSPYQVIDGRPEPGHIFLSAFDHRHDYDANDAKGYEQVNVDECITTLWAENLLEVFHGGHFKAEGVNVSLWFLHYSDSCLSGANWREIPSALQRLDGVGRCLEQTVDGTPYFPSWAPAFKQLFLTTEGARWDWTGEETPRPCHDLMPPFRRWASVDGASDLLRHLGTRAARKACDRPFQWLVDGAIPHGTVTLLAGAPTVGKSTAALDLAARLASDELPRRWLGQSIQGTPGVVAYLSGEDPEGIVNARLEALDPDDTAERLLLLTDAEGGLSGVCDRLKKLPELALLIVDPARKYLDGDEDGSASASEFFTALEQLAIRQKCAVVVIHHLTKNACPRSLEGVRAALRGSSVWTDRPRVMLAMYRRGEHTMAGVAKHNIPPQFPMMVEGCFSHDDETQRLESVGDVTKTEATDGSDGDDLDRRVLAALARLVGKGFKIRRSGRDELYAHKPAELADVSRNRIRQSISTLLKNGLLRDGANGIVISP